jgi:hypothetical protein
MFLFELLRFIILKLVKTNRLVYIQINSDLIYSIKLKTQINKIRVKKEIK